MIKEKVEGYRRSISENKSFTMKEQLGYCGGIFGNCMGQDCLNTFFDKFCRKYMGIEANMLTLLSNIAMALGFVVSPISGTILDRPTPEGKPSATKVITGITPIPFALTSLLLFIVPTSDPSKNFLWAMIFKLIFNTADSFYDASLNTLSLRMTNNPKDRKNFYTIGTLASSLGSMLPGWLIPLLVGSAGNDVGAQKKYYFVAAVVFCILGVSLMYAPFFTLREKIKVTSKPKKGHLSWDRDTVKAVFHNRPFMIQEIATFFEQIRQVSYTLLPYIYEDVLSDFKLKALMDIVSGSLSYVGLALVPFLTGKFAPCTVISGGFAYTGIFYTLLGILGLNFKSSKLQKRKLLIGLLIGLAGMPNNAIAAAKKVVVGDSTDYMEWYSIKEYGRPIHAEGFITTIQGVLGGVFNVFRTNMYNIVFGKLGYKASLKDALGNEIEAVQSESTLKGIYMMFVLCGVVGNFLAAITYRFDNYTGKRKEAIFAELTEIRNSKLQEMNETDSPEDAAADEQ